jgi:hypothetical protein
VRVHDSDRPDVAADVPANTVADADVVAVSIADLIHLRIK